MIITDLISITELSRITNKSRPTIYKYINDYHERKFDEIPYSFIVLFNMVEIENASKQRVIDYCNRTYGGITIKEDRELSELVNFMVEKREHLNLDRIRTFIEQELSND